MTPSDKLREIADTWSRTYSEMKQLESDLTALLEQHKEMILREELIKYDEWVFENGKAFADTKKSVDEYIEYLKNEKK